MIPDRDTDCLLLSKVLTIVGQRLQASALRCANLQDTISTLLDRFDHPDLGAEIHMLQDIDRLQQSLFDLAAVMHVGASEAGDRTIKSETLSAAVRMESLRAGFFEDALPARAVLPERRGSADQEDHAAEPPAGRAEMAGASPGPRASETDLGEVDWL